PALAVDQRGSAVADKENVESHVSPASLQARDPSGLPREGVEEVDLHPPAAPALHGREENQPPNSNINNSDGLQPQQPTLSASKGPTTETPKPEMENMPTSEISNQDISKPTDTVEDTPSIKEVNHNNTTESNEHVQETITESPSHNGNDEGTNTTVDTTHSPNSPATDNEKNETIVNTHNNTTNSTTTSIPENVNAAVAPATLTELNNTQVGQVMNQAATIVIAGADSSISASYQISLLLIVSALVALASP
ncbi:uncharacterized protein TM35_000701000, partial [Trypanosoma theileri]